MALRLKIVSRHRQGLGERSTKEFGRDGGTIGRSLDCDWALPDGHRYLSSRHASIDYHSGSYYVLDTSTNGVYVNESDTPVGKGNPQRLFSGDRIRIGEYEFAVEIDEEDDTGKQLADGHVDPVKLAQRVPPPDPTRADLLQAPAPAPSAVDRRTPTTAAHGYPAARASCLPGAQFILRQRIEKAIIQRPSKPARSPLDQRSLQRHEPGVGPTRFGEDDLLAAMGQFEQAGQVCLGLMHVDDGAHIDSFRN
jgi:type VI secretion system FHA domain protein